MKWILLLLFSILAILVLLIFTKVQIELTFVHRNQNTDVKIKVRLFRFITFSLKLPKISIDSSNSLDQDHISSEVFKKKKRSFPFAPSYNRLHLLQSGLSRIRDFFPIAQEFMKKIRISRLEWHSAVGLGDAASSAILTGFFWSIKGVVLQFIHYYFSLSGAPAVSIIPVFQAVHSETRFSCMISFKVGHTIGVMFKLFKSWRKNRPLMKEKKEYISGGM